MGFLDALRGRTKLKGPAPDRLFALTTAEVTLTERLGLTPAGRAAVVFQPLSTADFSSIVAEVEELVRGTSSDSDTTLTTSDDAYGYRWMVFSDEDFEDLVVAVNAVSGGIESGGYGERVLCAVFAFAEGGGSGRSALWIYNYKRGTFYPFVPGPGDQTRDSEAELRYSAQIGPELPVEPELERWFPLWGAPV